MIFNADLMKLLKSINSYNILSYGANASLVIELVALHRTPRNNDI